MMLRALLCCTLFFFHLAVTAEPDPYPYCKKYQSDSSVQWHVAPNDKVNSLKHALTKAKPGDHILLASGDYNQSVRIQTPGLTIRSKKLHQARVIVSADNKQQPFAVRIDPHAHCTTLSDLDISGGYFYAISLESNWTAQVSATSVKYVQLLNNRIHGSGRDVVKIKPMVSYVTLWGNHIFSSGQRDPRNAEGIDVVNGHDLLIAENLIENTATTGVYVKGGSSNAVIVRNYLRNIGSGGILLGFDTSPQFFNLENNPQMYEVVDSIAAYNIIENTTMAGVGIYAANNVSVFSNTLNNVATKGQAGFLFGISYQDKIQTAKRPPSTASQVFYNILASGQRGKQVEIRAEQHDVLGYLSAFSGSPQMFGNLHKASQNPAAYQDKRKNSLFNSDMLAEWREHIKVVTLPQSQQSNIVMNNPLQDFPKLQLDASLLPKKALDFCGQTASYKINVGALFRKINSNTQCANQTMDYLQLNR